jgi:hypothetical protein
MDIAWNLASNGAELERHYGYLKTKVSSVMICGNEMTEKVA